MFENYILEFLTVAFVFLLLGVIAFLLKQIAEQNQTIIQLVQENSKAADQCKPLGESDDSDDSIDENYRLPYFTDSEEEEEENDTSFIHALLKNGKKEITHEKESSFDGKHCLPNSNSSAENETDALKRSKYAITAPSGYVTDRDWEIFEINNDPPGPVPYKQTLLLTSCPGTDFYVKAITNEEQSMVYIVTYEQTSDNGCEWLDTTCQGCIEKVKTTMAERGNQIPFAVDFCDGEESEDGSDGPKEEESDFGTGGADCAN